MQTLQKERSLILDKRYVYSRTNGYQNTERMISNTHILWLQDSARSNDKTSCRLVNRCPTVFIRSWTRVNINLGNSGTFCGAKK